MFGTKAARGSRTSKQVQNWVDDGMHLVRDGAKHPAMWGAALSVALAALVGYSAYRGREDSTAGRRTSRTAAAKTAPPRTRKSQTRARRKPRTPAKTKTLDE